MTQRSTSDAIDAAAPGTDQQQTAQWVLKADERTVAGLDRRSVPRPDPAAGQVRIRVEALSINARDVMILAGPFGRITGAALVPLSDVAGRVDAVADGVDGWSVGSPVMTAHVPLWRDGRPPLFGIGPGSLDDPGVAAEHIVVDADALLRAPSHLTAAEASTLQVAGVTAWNSVFAERPVGAGDAVVVIGSGGVSMYAAQLATAVGARVYVAVRNPDQVNDPRWQDISPSGFVTTDSAGWGARLFKLTGGADKVVDTIGSGAVEESMAALGQGGEVAVPGLLDPQPPTVDVMEAIGKQTSLRGVAVGSVTMHRDLAAFMVDHDIRPVIDRHIPFERLPEAYAAMSGAGGLHGKVVIDVGR